MPANAGASPAASMDLVGGDPCLDFVNTVGGRATGTRGARYSIVADKLAAYSDLVAFAVHAGLMPERTARSLLRRSQARPGEAKAVLERAVACREALYRTLLTQMRGRRPAAADLRVLNAELSACRSREQLAAGAAGLGWSFRDEGEELASPLWPVVSAAGALLTGAARFHVGRCGGKECRWMFLDKSRNHSRQWCTMKDCGNVSKVRRFRKRHRR